MFWLNTPKSKLILTTWWNSAGIPYRYQKTKFKSKWRNKWPWEQAQIYEMYEQFKSSIMILFWTWNGRSSNSVIRKRCIFYRLSKSTRKVWSGNFIRRNMPKSNDWRKNKKRWKIRNRLPCLYFCDTLNGPMLKKFAVTDSSDQNFDANLRQ